MTPRRPTAEEIATLFTKHGIRPQGGFYYTPISEDDVRPETACVIGILAFDAGQQHRVQDWAIETYGECWREGAIDGFDDDAERASAFVMPANQSDYAAGYAVGQEVRRLVLP